MHEISEFLQSSVQCSEHVEDPKCLLRRDWMSLSLEEAGPTGLDKPLYPGEKLDNKYNRCVIPTPTKN